VTKETKLLTRDFLFLNFIIFLTYCNIAVFFQLHQYLLHALHISEEGAGFLIGLFALTALVLRPVISPLLRPDNARKWIFIGAAGVFGSLLFYHLARGFPGMAVVRIVHGAFYVLMATAVMARLVACIPRARSAEAFGIISVITLLPYAVFPPLIAPLIAWLGGFIPVLDITALLMLPILPLLAFIKPAGDGGSGDSGRLTFAELKENLGNRQIVGLLLVSLLVFTAFTPVFYFLKGYAKSIGIRNAGWFFTISTIVEIMVRLIGGRLMDRGNKLKTLLFSLILLLAGYLILAHTASPVTFFALALLFGLAWGIALPILNGLVFDYSPPKLRAFNANLGLEMFQGGFFLGPLLGGIFLTTGSYRTLYYVCGGLIIAALVMLPLLTRKETHQGGILR